MRSRGNCRLYPPPPVVSLSGENGNLVRREGAGDLFAAEFLRNTDALALPSREGAPGGLNESFGFPLPPLKFRTAGFPQYGFKWTVNGDLRRQPEA